MKPTRRLTEFYWLMAPIVVCLLLALVTLVILETKYHESHDSEAAQSGSLVEREPRGGGDAYAAKAGTAQGPELRDLYHLTRNTILAACLVAAGLLVCLVFWLWRSGRTPIEPDVLYQQVLDHLPLMVRIRDLNGLVRFENRATHLSDVPTWGTLDLLEPTHDPRLPPLSRMVWETQRDTLREGILQERFTEIGSIEEPDYRAYRLIAFPIYDHSGRACALGSLAIDETEQSCDRQSLIKLTADLERQVQARTAELSAAKEQAEAATEAKARFLANMSHEIRSPLSALVGLTHLARRRNRDPQLDDYLGKILKSAEHLQNVVGDILDFSKIEAGEMKIERVAFSLQRLLDSVVDMVWARVSGKSLQLIVDVDPRLPGQFYGDPLRMAQILINFMDNAIKFTERGTISLRVLQGEVQGDRHHLHFEIQDSGLGIPADQLDEIFKPFQQVDDSITRRYGGTGLGLAICAELAALLGGQLTARSEPGVGSLFRFSLVLERTPAQPVAEGSVQTLAEHSLIGRHVLLVEDDALNREVAAELLSIMGLRVSTAVNGADALHCISQDPSIELVLLDMQMPVMDGLQTIRLLRISMPSLPVVAMTANNLKGDRERCLQAGVSDYLAKPIDPVQLESVLERWLCLAARPAEPVQTSPRAVPGISPIPGVDHEAALARLLGNRALYMNLLRRFVEDHGDVARQLHDSLMQGRLVEAKEALHRFKSMAGTLGAETLQQLSMELEQALQDGEAWAEAYDRFAAEFVRLLEAVKVALARDAS